MTTHSTLIEHAIKELEIAIDAVLEVGNSGFSSPVLPHVLDLLRAMRTALVEQLQSKGF